MAKKKLTLQSLQDLDHGMLDKIFQNHLATASNDCYQRPEDKTVRKVTITLSFKPVQSLGALDRVETTVDFATSLPKMKSRTYNMQPEINRGSSQGLMFHPDLPDDPDGSTIMDVAEAEENDG